MKNAHVTESPGPQSRPDRLRTLRMGVAVVFLSICVGGGPVVASSVSEADVAIAEPSIPGKWSSTILAPGMELHEGFITRGEGRWTVTIRMDGAEFPQDIMSVPESLALVMDLRSKGVQASAFEVAWPKGYLSQGESLGRRVVLDESYPDEAAAKERARALFSEGWNAVAQWSGAEPDSPDLQAHLMLAVMDPEAMPGRLIADYGTSIDGRATVAETVARSDAILAVNAGFFVADETQGIPGVPSGIGVYEGRLHAEATNGRMAVILREDSPYPTFVELSTEVIITSGDVQREVDGVNRVPGLIRDCGGVGGDLPTESPRHDFTCTDEHEVILFSDALEGSTPEVSGIEVVVDGESNVMETREPGGSVPAGGYTLQGIGEGAAWLERNTKVGTRLSLHKKVSETATGNLLDWEAEGVSVINAGPRLVRDGRVEIDAVADGLLHPEDPSFVYRWALRRAPRMVIGVDDESRVLLLALSGRTPGVSDGLGLHEAAELMRDLGAREAVALDGGGSVNMVVEGETVLVGVPSQGERAVGDVLLVRTEP